MWDCRRLGYATRQASADLMPENTRRGDARAVADQNLLKCSD
jgi:hypothetical protein